MSLQENITKVLNNAISEIDKIKNSKDLDRVRVSILGKKGTLTALLRSLGQLSKNDRPSAGLKINQAREKILFLLNESKAKIQDIERTSALEIEKIDISQPVSLPNIGSPSPISLVLEEMVNCFIGMGFEVVEGPEIELDLYNFELLNLPKDHPARDAQDTFYIDENIVLRTHTSPVQARTMLDRSPPIRIICPGRTYRADEVDATHSPVFHQIEGLVVDKDVNMGDLKRTLEVFAKKLYGDDVKLRFRPSFFPFTEPSAEVDFTCANCKGKGCRNCKYTGWIEVLGSGMVNPKVFELCGIDPDIYSGFAFGIGLERVAMQRYGISDMRLLYEGDMRFVSQFYQTI